MKNNCSFIIYFHSKRIKNLNQTLRFLAKREEKLLESSEIILICQNKCNKNKINSLFKKTIVKNLNLDYYNKPLMNNIGVNLSNNEIIVLLDSDRILPKYYFTRNIEKIKKGQIITTLNLKKLQKEYPDNDIENLNYKVWHDDRSLDNAAYKKGVFSGNTIMYKSDYLEPGGMDESFCGYGFADNDFMQTMKALNKEFVFLEDLELHLDHSYENLKKRKIENFKNAIKYILKWNLEVDNSIIKKSKELNFNLDKIIKEKNKRKYLHKIF